MFKANNLSQLTSCYVGMCLFSIFIKENVFLVLYTSCTCRWSYNSNNYWLMIAICYNWLILTIIRLPILHTISFIFFFFLFFYYEQMVLDRTHYVFFSNFLILYLIFLFYSFLENSMKIRVFNDSKIRKFEDREIRRFENSDWTI